jgi:hypothetical protein
VKSRWFGPGLAAAALTALVASPGGFAQVLNQGETADTSQVYPGEPLGGAEDERAEEPPAREAPPPPEPQASIETGTYGIQWAEHVSPSFRKMVPQADGRAAAPSAERTPGPDEGSRYGVQWADHVSPSFRRWVEGESAAAEPVYLEPQLRNRPSRRQQASDLAPMENAIDEPAPEPMEPGGRAGTAKLLKRVSIGHAYYLVAPEGSLMGAELTAGIITAPVERSRSKGTVFDRLPEKGAASKVLTGSLPGGGPLQAMPEPETYDGGPIFHDLAAPETPPRTYAVAVDRGTLVGVELGERVYVAHIAQFAKDEVPQNGDFVVYPRSDFRPFGLINSFEALDPFRTVNVEPLQTSEDPSDPAPVARSAYAMNEYGGHGYVNVPLSDRSLYEFRQGLIDRERDPRRCCGPNRVTIMHNPFALGLVPSSFDSTPGATFQVIPLAPGMRVW